jgi:anaerobic selenocysteine-containing dehydrogenase
MCHQFCPANATVKDGKVIGWKPARCTNTRESAAARARRPGALYSDDRITTPLIRTGERGEGKFRKASWQEALDLVGRKLKKLRDDDEPEKVVLFSRFSSCHVQRRTVAH